MHRFEAYQSRTQLLRLLLMCAALFIMGAYCATRPELKAQIAGWACMMFFGLGFVIVPLALLRTTRPVIVMDENGIHTGSSLGVVDWADVTGVRVDAVKSMKVLSIFVVDKHKYLDRMSPLARKSAALHPQMGLSEITLSFVSLAPGIDEACFFLQERGIAIADAQ